MTVGSGRFASGGQAAAARAISSMRVGAALGFGAGEFGRIHIALAEAIDRDSPVVVEFAVDVPGEDLQELGSADLIKRGVQRPAAVGVLVHHRVAAGLVAFGLVRGADRVGQRFPRQCAAFELDEGDVHGVGHQIPHTLDEHVRFDARVRSDTRHQPGLGDTDLAAGQRVVPHPDRLPQPGLLHPPMRLSTRQLQMMLHPRLRGEEPKILERLRSIEMLGHRNARCGGLAAQLLDTLRPRHRRGGIEPGRINTLQQRQPLRTMLHHRRNPLRAGCRDITDRDIGHRIKPTGVIGWIPREIVTEHPASRRRPRRPRPPRDHRQRSWFHHDHGVPQSCGVPQSSAEPPEPQPVTTRRWFLAIRRRQAQAAPRSHRTLRERRERWPELLHALRRVPVGDGR